MIACKLGELFHSPTYTLLFCRKLSAAANDLFKPDEPVEVNDKKARREKSKLTLPADG